MWTVSRGVYIDQLNMFQPSKVVFKAPTYSECLSIVKKYGCWGFDYAITHNPSPANKQRKPSHVLTGENLKRGKGAFTL